jgi:scyllo-inositol 2-dehydrogenase (NADP+)
MKKINTAIIGFGVTGRVFHAPFVGNIPQFDLKMMSTSQKDATILANNLYPKTKIVADAKAILEDKSIELIILGTPNATHFPLAKTALLAGKHVIVDKPFTVTSAEADALITLAKKQNLLLSVHHNRRFASDFKTVQKVINSGFLGNLVEYEAHYDRFRPSLRPHAWREHEVPGAGILYDLGSHLIDQSLMLFGLPETVYADTRIQRVGTKATDHFELVLNYPNLKVTLKASMLAKNPAPTFLLHGDRGSFVKYGMDVQEDFLRAGVNPFSVPNWGEEPENIWGQITSEHEGETKTETLKSEIGAYQDYFFNIYEAITAKTDLLVTAEQSRDVIRVIELAMMSSEEKRWIDFVNE